MACTVLGCGSRVAITTEKNINISFHRFPSDLDLKRLWIKNINKGAKWRPSQYTRICSLHFQDSCFREGYRRRTLHSYAVPSIFPHQLLPRQQKLIKKINRVNASMLSTLTYVKTNGKRPLDSKTKTNGTIQTDNIVTQTTLKKMADLLNKYKTLVARRSREMKKLKRQCSRLAKKKADLESTFIRALYKEMESEHITFLIMK